MTLAQRNYKSNSVLATGNWYKIKVNKAGIYKIDIPFLNNLGINTTSLPSGSIRLYGNGGAMLPEANQSSRYDDLEENAIMVVDGGDGVLNGNDFILFYANGPDQWIKDSTNLRFSHQKNLFSDWEYYFLTIGGTGKRIPVANNNFSPNITVNSFSERYFHELDTVNFLSSGKEWYGEEFMNAPGKTLIRNFPITIPNVQNIPGVTLISNCVSRSVGSNSIFDVKINSQSLGQMSIPAVSGAVLDLFAQQMTSVFNGAATQSGMTVTLTYNPGSLNSQGWLNWFELFCRRNLSMAGTDQLLFRDWLSVGNNNAADFAITNATSKTQVWDITDPLSPVLMQGNFANNEYHFVNTCSRLREYIAFNNNNFLTPEISGKINYQNLHNASPADYLVIAHPSLLPQAQRLAQFHQQQNGLRTVVVTTDQVYNEFSSGISDPTAIRDFAKMYYDKFGNNANTKPKFLLLFGDASYDFKNRLVGNTNLVPAYENNFSLDPLATYTSDDFYGFLDDNEDINSTAINNLDLGIGRVPASNVEESKNFVDKIIAYADVKSLGAWRNNTVFVADDEDNNLHLQDAEVITGTVKSIAPVFNLQKIYLDAFQQENGAGGSHYPKVNEAINNRIYNGTFIWNYNGHGGANRLAEETILDQEMVNTWNNPYHLPLFITATCDFAPYDNPFINSLGENILLRPKTGGIALMTTTRPVYAFSNRIMNNNYMQFALQPDANGKYRSLGDAVKDAKNYTYQSSGDIANNRKFTLLGDPALTLAFPQFKVTTTRINNLPISQPDTLRTTDTVQVEGEVTDQQGNLLNTFNGTVYPTVFDKPQMVTTLANDITSQVTSFSSQVNVLFKGKSSVSGGKFTFRFKMPKDINLQYGNGRLSLYAENGVQDASGYFDGFVVGGVGSNNGTDNEGPGIKAYLNDEKFVNGGICNQDPVLIVKLTDSSGINTSGNGIGHDIVVTLDNDNNKFFILNDFYESELNNYQQGAVHFQLPTIEPGPHSLKIKAWDILNNSNEYVLDFIVATDKELLLDHVLNYPNPFTTKTQFWFEHNKPGENLDVKVEIFTISGRLIKSIKKTINSPGNRSSEVEWNGRDEYGEKVGRGVYLYRLSVTAPGNLKKERTEKLIIF